jgi:aminomethyltransferase
MASNDANGSQPIRLPLYDRLEALGGRFVDFAGFAMPLRFGSIVEEHEAVRRGVGIFDVSHMGEVEFQGPAATAVLQRICTNDIARLEDGHALYTVMCHPSGGIVDDLIVYRFGADHYLACVNASNRAKDLAHMLAVAADHGGECEVTDRGDEIVQIAVQGPDAVELVAALAEDVSSPLEALAPFTFGYASIAGERVLVSRTGYTGEDGFELYYDAGAAEAVFDAIWGAGQLVDIAACGLAARDTLRLEARLMLYGNDLNDQTTPLEAGLGWVVKLEKGDFVGRDALLAQKAAGVPRRLRGFLLSEGERGVLRPHYPILADGVVIGETTSGGPGPTVGRSIALGYVPAEYADRKQLDIEVRGKALRCDVTTKPFYKRHEG